MHSLHIRGLATALLIPTVFLSSHVDDTIARDVCILGGGATGTYAAVQLIERGRSVVIVEPKDHLGGHSDMAYLPGGKELDFGIRAYFDQEVVKDFFAQLHVEHELFHQPAILTDYVNLETGQRVLPSSTDALALLVALIRYRKVTEPFNYLIPGAFDLPDEVPEVLLRPFREFVEEHDLQAALPIIYTFTDALGDVLKAPLLYVLQLFGPSHIDALLEGPYIRPRNGSSTLFRQAARYIDEDHNVLYGSAVTKATRSSDGVELVVKTANGDRKVVSAKKLLITFPPILSNLYGFDLDENEQLLFSKWKYINYYAAVLTNTGIPDGFNIFNTDPENQPGGLPTAPYQCIIDYSGFPGYYRTRIMGAMDFSEDDARQLVMDDFRRMGEAGTFPITEEPEIVALESHVPSTMMVSVDDVRAGFYRKLYALQGVRSTYYTGLTFCTDYSTQLWNYTLGVVNMVDL
ncbi:hypothetical protein BJY04DRAFT_36999 [Aspergillus karnatakaensis]|uniref:uncharacterized protein n=1 Tax=Aspergillus karnatakaensis TaxID=1810916 RepID=UPI003CCCB5C8